MLQSSKPGPDSEEAAYRGSYSDLGLKVLHSYARIADGWYYTNLEAPYWRFYWNEKQGCTLDFDNKLIQMQPDKFYLIPPETSYSAEGKGKYNHFYIHFTAKPPYDEVAQNIYEIETHPAFLNYASVALQQTLVKKDSSPSAALLMQYYMLISYSLSRLPADAVHDLPHDLRVSAVIRYMEQNLDRKLSSKELAAAAGLSPQSLFRVFKSALKVSPQEYFKSLRIRQACIYLQFSKYSIEEIAESLGFADRFHFTRIFTEKRNISPAAFRKIRNQYHRNT